MHACIRILHMHVYHIYTNVCSSAHIGGRRSASDQDVSPLITCRQPCHPILIQAGVDYKSRPLVPIKWLARHHVGGM